MRAGRGRPGLSSSRAGVGPRAAGRERVPGGGVPSSRRGRHAPHCEETEPLPRPRGKEFRSNPPTFRAAASVVCAELRGAVQGSGDRYLGTAAGFKISRLCTSLKERNAEVPLTKRMPPRSLPARCHSGAPSARGNLSADISGDVSGGSAGSGPGVVLPKL